MIQQKNFYLILGLEKTANEEDIKTAYRKLAIKYHPDKNPNDKIAEEKFKEITEAYETLKDPIKRNKYDLLNISSNIFTGQFDFSNFDLSGFSSIKQSKRGRRGSDIKISLNITLDEVFTGSKKVIKYKRHDKCSNCCGTGSLTNEKNICSRCNGTGKIRNTITNGHMMINQHYICDQCNGLGKSIKYDCSICQGKGVVLKDCTLEIPINKGVQEDIDNIFKYYGHQGERNGLPGNLIVKFKTKTHEKYIRQGDNIIEVIKIPYTTAIFGTNLQISTFHGKNQITICSGILSHSEISIANYGLPNFYNPSNFGNHIVRIIIDVPVNITDEQKNILCELQKVGL
jgi:molecular chaperone DnaJ